MKRIFCLVVVVLLAGTSPGAAQTPDASAIRDEATFQQFRGMALEQVRRLSSVIPSNDEERVGDWGHLYDLERALDHYSIEIDNAYSNSVSTETVVAQWNDLRDTAERVELVFTYNDGFKATMLHREVGSAIQDFGTGRMTFEDFSDYVDVQAATIPEALAGLLRESIRSEVEADAVFYQTDAEALAAIIDDTRGGMNFVARFVRSDAIDDGDAGAADVYESIVLIQGQYEQFAATAATQLVGSWVTAVRYQWIAELLFYARIYSGFNGYADFQAALARWEDGNRDPQGLYDALWEIG